MHVVTGVTPAAAIGSSVFPCSCDQTGNADVEVDLGSGSILLRLDSGCSHIEICCNTRFEHGVEVDVRWASKIESSRHNN